MKPHIYFIIAAVGAGLCLSSSAEQKEGYFLPLAQKGNLIWRGSVEDAGGTWYNIRIVPGYQPPGSYGWKGIKSGGRNLREYVESDKYRAIRKQSGDALEWSYNDCLYDFALQGSGRAWKKYFGRAEKRVEKRVFGWWLSYPWALMQSGVDNVVRIPVGLAGTVAGTGWGVVVVPAYHAMDSSVKAVWNVGAEGCIVPVSGWTWNTVSSPVLSLVGQMPSKDRVDGFWVQTIEKGLEPGMEPNQQAKTDMAKWGAVLLEEFKTHDAQRKVINQQRDQRLAELRNEMEQVRQKASTQHAEVKQAEEQSIATLVNDPEFRELAAKVYGDNWTKNSIRVYRDDIRRALEKQGFSAKDQQAITRILQQYPPSVSNVPPPEKTDPLKESIQVIQAID